jgi:hypothetical protein
MLKEQAVPNQPDSKLIRLLRCFVLPYTILRRNGMLRKFIAFAVAFALTLTGIMGPAYADSSSLGISFDNHKENNSAEYYTYGDSYYGNTSQDPAEQFAESLVQGAVGMAGMIVGGTITCLALDGIATVVFPPAAALAAFCPAIGGASGGAGAIAQLAR